VDGLIAFLILAVPVALLMGLAYLLGARKRIWLMLASVIGGTLPGVFIASAASAMATAVDPQSALLRGGLIGAGAGLVVGVLILLMGTAVTRARTIH
jgi:Na+-translocating ferredoxin:NAD+ oxidoreductase RnfD subunit